MRQPLLQIDNLSVGYHDRKNGRTIEIIRHVDLTVGRHAIVGLVGESGSGKTQTTRAILRLNTPPLHPLSGQILLDGEDVLQLEGRRLQAMRGSKVAMIFQDPRASLNPLMRVGDQLARIYTLHKGISRDRAHAEAIEMLRRVGIAGPERVARSYPHQLSGGMCQRVMISLCLGMNPALLIADEPTTGVDVTIQAQILELIREIQDETGTSVLLITHDLGVVAEICQRVAVMYAGRVVEVAQVGDLFSRPLHPYTMRLLRASLELEGPQDGLRDAEPPHEIDFTVGTETYRASLESARDPAALALMVEVDPGHVVLGVPVAQGGSMAGAAMPSSAGAAS